MNKSLNGIFKIDDISYFNECLDVIHISFKNRDEKLGFGPTGHSILSYNDFVKMYENGIQMYGYFLDNKIVGFVSFDIRDNEIKIKDIVVLPKYQNMGLGKKLLDYVKNFAFENSKSRIILSFYYDNKKLLSWYESNGFRLYDTVVYPNSDKKIGKMEYISNELKINNINLNDIVDLLVLSNGSDIDVFYNDEMSFFPSTVFDGYDSSYKEKIINKSIRLPKIKEIYNDEVLREKYYSIIMDFCKDNDIKYVGE